MKDREDFKLPRRSYSTQREIRSRIKTYPNGDKKITTFAKPLIVFENIEVFGEDVNDKIKEKVELSEEEKLKEQDRIIDKRFREVRNKIEDYARSNDFTHFITLTQDTKIVGDRFDDEIALSNLDRFLKTIRKQAKRKEVNLKYIVVPERHKNNALHFHMLVHDYPYEFIDSNHVRKKRKIYKCEQWKYGISDVIEIYGDGSALGNYIKKYVTKQMMTQNLGRSKKKYWCSKGLLLPKIEYYDTDVCENMKEDWVSSDGNVKIYNIKGVENND